MALKIKTISIGLLAKVKPIKYSKINIIGLLEKIIAKKSFFAPKFLKDLKFQLSKNSDPLWL